MTDQSHEPMHLQVGQVSTVVNQALDELERAVIGKRSVLQLIMCGLLADGHVLLEDVPGLAKTLIARSLAQVSQLQFARVQFTPDLVPADITGSTVLKPSTGDTYFQPGPLFANLVLGDEINRAPPKTQAALLEAMEERQVTNDGVTHPLPKPFIVVATQNPIESEGTYPLPEAQLDRFLFKTSIGYPGTAAEIELLRRRAQRQQDNVDLRPVLSPQIVVALQQAVERVAIDADIATYIVALVESTRASNRTDAGASPRGSLALLKAGRSWAAINGRDFVVPDDIKAVAIPALSHRILVKPNEWVRGVTGQTVVEEALARVPQPQAISSAAAAVSGAPMSASSQMPAPPPAAAPPAPPPPPPPPMR